MRPSPRRRPAVLGIALVAMHATARAQGTSRAVAGARVCTVPVAARIDVTPDALREVRWSSVRVCGAPLVVTLFDDHEVVEATAPLAFRGAAAFDAGSFRNARPLRLAGGMVQLATGSRLQRRRVVGGAALFDLPTAWGTLVDLSVRCDALRFFGDAASRRPPPRQVTPDGTWWRQPVAQSVTFREGPGTGRSVVVTEGVEYQRIERSGAWWRMLLEDAEVGVRLVGWLPRDILARSGGEEVTGIFGVAGHGYLNAGAGVPIEHGDYFGLARLTEGATVYAEPDATA